MTRDSQRSKVYNAEYRLFSRAAQEHITTDDAVKLLHRVSRKFYTSQPGIRWATRPSIFSRGSYSRYRRCITIHNQVRVTGACTDTVLHEYAHHLCYDTYGVSVAAHGPEFVRSLVEVMKWAGHFAGRFSMWRAKVRIAPAGPFWEACHQRRNGKAAGRRATAVTRASIARRKGK